MHFIHGPPVFRTLGQNAGCDVQLRKGAALVGNGAFRAGGAFVLEQATLSIKNATVHANWARQRGGAVAA